MGSGTLTRRLCQVCAFAASLLPGVVSGLHEEELPTQFDVEFIEPADLQEAAETGIPYELRIGGEVQLLLVEPVDLRSYRFKATTRSRGRQARVYKSPPRTFKGRVLDDPDSVVRLSITKSGVRGYVRTTDDWTFIRPVPRAAALAEGEHMLFTDADLGESVVGTCSAIRATAENRPRAEPVQSIPIPTPTPAALGVFELAVDADFEYFTRYGPDTVTEIESILNEVSGIFEAELALSIEIVHINVWQDPADPYDSTDSGVMLDEFRTYWGANMTSIGRDAAHLFTGKELDDLTVGLAFLDAVCQSFAYGLTQDLNPPSLVPVVVAHELGHNLGSDHDVTGSTPRYIMYPNISGANLTEFSSGSKSQIASYLTTVTCVETGAGSLPPPSSSGGSSGGPVDPLLLVALAAALTGWRRAGHDRS